MNFKSFYEDVNMSGSDLQSLYDQYNREYFDGKLPKVPLRLTKSKTKLGAVRTIKRGMFAETEIEELFLSTSFNRTEEEMKGTLLHEMIHVWEIANGYSDMTGFQQHGPVFERKRKEISEKSGIEISHTEDIRDMNISDKVKEKELIVMLYKKRDEYSIAVFDKKSLDKNQDSLDIIQDIARRNSNGSIVIFILKSNKSFLQKFPIKRGYSHISFYGGITTEEAEDLIKDAKEKDNMIGVFTNFKKVE